MFGSEDTLTRPREYIMSTLITDRPSSSSPWFFEAQARSLDMSSTTPLSRPPRTPGSAGQILVPKVAARGRTPRPSQDLRPSSPSYFEFMAESGSNPTDSNAGDYARKNWSSTATGLHQSAGVSPQAPQTDDVHTFEAFRKQSQNNSFRLSHGNLSHFSQGSGTDPFPSNRGYGEVAIAGTLDRSPWEGSSPGTESKAAPSHQSPRERFPTKSPSVDQHMTGDVALSSDGLPRMESSPDSPSLDWSKMQKERAQHLGKGNRPNSLPQIAARPLSPSPLQHGLLRADTLPSNMADGEIELVSPQAVVALMDNHTDLLVLDLRVFPQFSHSRIEGAINLCIPTTLLKRPNFNVQRLLETFTKTAEKAKFARWREAKAIVVYDTGSIQLKDATSSVNTLKKFTKEGWRGSAMVIRGGHSAFAASFPDRIDKRLASEIEASTTGKLAIDPQGPLGAPVAGGCPMPSAQTAANPFFSNIRQNMDLIGGVGQLAVKLPPTLTLSGTLRLPPWLRRVVDEKDDGKIVADRFFKIEQAEQQRMQKAFSGIVSYGSPNPTATGGFQIAGFEKGSKNRYKDMLPYDHSRVRLQDVPSGGCDYVNASHIRSEWSHRHYVATQAPVPATFQVSRCFSGSAVPCINGDKLQDFWRVVWEQDARVIVMLTAESEGGQRKCHPYWLPGEYGQFRLKSLSERKVSLEAPKRASTIAFSPLSIQPPRAKRPTIDRRRSTNNSIPGQKDFPTPGMPADHEAPDVIVRKLALFNNIHPSQPMREITQLQYSHWPDFGAPAHPAHVLSLVEYCGTVVRSYDGSNARSADRPADKDERPIMVHCSAGCGRTGTFCTVDSVIDRLKRQRQQSKAHRGEMNKHDGGGGDDDPPDRKDIDEMESEGDWFSQGQVDMVAHTVENFRLQRLSMVQTLRQFVLCYESILEWLAKAIRNEGLDGGKGC